MSTFNKLLLITCLCLAWLAPTATGSASSSLPSIVGAYDTTKVRTGESLMEVARRTGFGYRAVVQANPAVDPWLPQPGTTIILPGKAILPDGTASGLTINLAEMRLYQISASAIDSQIKVYPLGIGRAGRETPEGRYQVINKREKPAWRVPGGLKVMHPELPDLVLPGPDNPLGRYWLGLSAPGYGIHGTNRPLGVGRRISYGCLRLYPEDIETVFAQTEIGTPVTIVYQPVKVGWNQDTLMIEVHPDYLHRFDSLFQEALYRISRTGAAADIDYAHVQQLVEHPDGLLHQIGERAVK